MRVAKFLLVAITVTCALPAVAISNPASGFTTEIEPWDIWLPSVANATGTIDHAEWQQLLDKHLVTTAPDGVYRFDYAVVTTADRALLQAYLDQLAHTDPRDYTRAEQLAYWINLYNALTVAVVVQHYPVESIREIYGGLFNTGPWDEELIEVAGQPLTLNDIEHRILRPIWRDPRIHFAVNCASLGCPNLAAQAYTSSNSDELLAVGAVAYISHPRGVSFADDRPELSSIFDWYDTDFGANQAARLQYLAEFAQPEMASKLNAYKGSIQYDYDWRLNSPDN